MVRAFFLLLVLANLAIFVWGQGYLDGVWEVAGREPERLNEQFQANRLTVAVRDDTAPPSPAPATQPATGMAIPCRRVGPLPVADAEKFKKVIVEKGGTANTISFDETSYWVHIPSTPGAKDAADKKSQELKQLGVTDFFIVNDEGVNRGAISLGLFHQEMAAKDFLQQLTKKGVRSAKIGTKVRKTEKVVLDVRGAIDLLDPILQSLATKYSDCPAE